MNPLTQANVAGLSRPASCGRAFRDPIRSRRICLSGEGFQDFALNIPVTGTNFPFESPNPNPLPKGEGIFGMEIYDRVWYSYSHGTIGLAPLDALPSCTPGTE